MCNFVSKVINTGIAFHETVGRDQFPASFFFETFLSNITKTLQSRSWD